MFVTFVSGKMDNLQTGPVAGNKGGAAEPGDEVLQGRPGGDHHRYCMHTICRETCETAWILATILFNKV